MAMDLYWLWPLIISFSPTVTSKSASNLVSFIWHRRVRNGREGDKWFLLGWRGLCRRQGESFRGGSAKIMRSGSLEEDFQLMGTPGEEIFYKPSNCKARRGLAAIWRRAWAMFFFPSQRKRLMTKFFKEAMTHGAWRVQIWE